MPANLRGGLLSHYQGYTMELIDTIEQLEERAMLSVAQDIVNQIKPYQTALTTAIDTALRDQRLDSLSIARNLLVHKAGVADPDYREDQKRAPGLPHLDLGQRLPLDGPFTVANVSAAVECGVALIQAVDKWLSNLLSVDIA